MSLIVILGLFRKWREIFQLITKRKTIKIINNYSSSPNGL